MPAPITAPMPRAVSDHGPRTRLRWSPLASPAAAVSGFLTNSPLTVGPPEGSDGRLFEPGLGWLALGLEGGVLKGLAALLGRLPPGLALLHRTPWDCGRRDSPTVLPERGAGGHCTPRGSSRAAHEAERSAAERSGVSGCDLQPGRLLSRVSRWTAYSAPAAPAEAAGAASALCAALIGPPS